MHTIVGFDQFWVSKRVHASIKLCLKTLEVSLIILQNLVKKYVFWRQQITTINQLKADIRAETNEFTNIKKNMFLIEQNLRQKVGADL